MTRSILLHAICLLTILAISGFITETQAQYYEYDAQEYRKISVSIHGGVTFGNNDSGLRFFGSNLNRITDQTTNIGGGIQYAILPFWSAGVEYGYTTVDGRRQFDTEINSVGLKSYFNFNRLYRRSSLSEYVNPYAMAGMGRDFFTVESDGTRFSRNEMYLSLGLGLAFNLTETIEVFGQHNFHFGSNSFDNNRQGAPTDLLSRSSAGIRVYFGNKDTRRLAMAPKTMRLSEQMAQEFHTNREKLPVLALELEQKESEIERLNKEMAELENQYEGEIASLTQSLNEYADMINSLEGELAEVRSDEIEDTISTSYGLPKGHYVQVFASSFESGAVKVRDNVLRMLANNLPCVDERIVITKRRKFFEVRIGKFNQFSIAEEILQSVGDTFDDAFIVSFPRPLHLSELYSDIRIIPVTTTFTVSQ